MIYRSGRHRLFVRRVVCPQCTGSCQTHNRQDRRGLDRRRWHLAADQSQDRSLSIVE